MILIHPFILQVPSATFYSFQYTDGKFSVHFSIVLTTFRCYCECFYSYLNFSCSLLVQRNTIYLYNNFMLSSRLLLSRLPVLHTQAVPFLLSISNWDGFDFLFFPHYNDYNPEKKRYEQTSVPHSLSGKAFSFIPLNVM